MISVATGHDPLVVREWPLAYIEAVEQVLVDQQDQAKIEGMKRGTQ